MDTARRRLRRPEFSAGSVLGPSFGIWLRNFVPFTLLIAFVHSPMIVYTYMVLTNDPTETDLVLWGRINMFVPNILNLIVSGALAYGVVQQLSKTPASMGACVTKGIQRLIPVFFIALLVGVLVFIGTLLFIIPGIILTCMLWVAVPAAVVERPGVMGALKRSASLTKGARWSIFLIVVVLFFVAVVGGVIVGVSIDDWVVSTWVTYGFTIVLGGLNATTAAVAYYQLRLSKEGVDIEQLKQVFA